MKIAFLNIYNGRVERGSEVFVDNLAENLSQNHNITVFQTGEKRKNGYRTFQITGIPFINIKSRFLEEIYHLLVFLFTAKCLPYLFREKFDWIVPINGRWQVLVCRLIRFFRGGKILISGHAGVGFDDRWNMIMGKPDIFVALTPQALSWAKGIYPADKLQYIQNGIDLDKFKERKEEQSFPSGKPVILCVSALQDYKRIDLLVEAVGKLKDAHLLIIGEGPLKEKIEKLGRQLLNDRFKLIAHVPHDEIHKYYSQSRVFSLPSRESEAFGLVYLEAMACNIPVVAPDDINRREIIGDAGLLGNLENVEVYSQLLDKALNTNFGNKPRNRAEKFSWVKIAQKYAEIFQKG